MITFTHGNLLKADAEALVNAVNTVGVMGKGLALMFKQAYPENFNAYKRACRDRLVRPGEVFVTHWDGPGSTRWIVNFPTKEHWRNPSRLEWIERGLADLARFVRENKIRSIAVPALGCGNGGLEWGEVRPLIEAAFAHLKDVDVFVYEPAATSRD